MTIWDHHHGLVAPGVGASPRQGARADKSRGSALAFVLIWVAFFGLVGLMNYLAKLLF